LEVVDTGLYYSTEFRRRFPLMADQKRQPRISQIIAADFAHRRRFRSSPQIKSLAANFANEHELEQEKDKR